MDGKLLAFLLSAPLTFVFAADSPDTIQISNRAEKRSGGRLFRHQSRRSLSAAGKSRLARIAEMDRGGKQNHVRFSKHDSGTGRNQETADRGLGLRAVRRAVQGKGPLLLFEEQRAPKPERSLHRRRIFPRNRASFSIRIVLAKDGTIALGGVGSDRRRQINGLRSRHRRVRLAAMESARRRHRQRSTGS